MDNTIDLNLQENFFGSLIKAFLIDISGSVYLNQYESNRINKFKKLYIPHFIPSTGDDTIYLIDRGYNNQIEPCEVSNQANTYYNKNPRCVVQVGGINLLNDQLTSPYTKGISQVTESEVYNEKTGELIEQSIGNYMANFRRFPVQVSVSLKYVLSSYFELLMLSQSLISNICNIRTFRFSYMGQIISASYKFPDSFQGEFNIEIDGSTTDSKDKTISLDLEIESNLPVYDNSTAMKMDKVILNTKANIKSSVLKK